MRSADCIVIGGGVMGCAIALRAAQAGLDVTVLERAIPGAEASSAAAGILAAQEESDGPGPLTTLALASRALHAALAEELRELVGVDVAYRRAGVLSACFSAEDEKRIEARYAWQRTAGMRIEWLRGEVLSACEPALAPEVTAGLWFPDDGQVEPRAFVRALSLAAARAGARFSTGAHVRRVVASGGRVRGVEVDGDTLFASSVVVAAGSWSSLVGGLEGCGLPPRAVRPMRGQLVRVETRPPAIRGTVISPHGGYVAGRADGSVLLGSTMEHAGFDKAVTVGGLRHVLEVACQLAPLLAAAPVVDSWANFRPVTDDELPVLGRTPIEGLILATGHFRNGILLAPVTAQLVRDLLVGAEPAFDLAPFSVSRFG